MPPARSPAIDLATLAQSDVAQGVLAGFTRRDLPKGMLLCTPSPLENQVFIVRAGRLKVFLAGENRELALGRLEVGDIYTTHTPTYIRTLTPVSLWMMDTPAFAAKLLVEPSLTPIMMRVLGRLLGDAVVLVEDLAFREVPARLARFFVGLARRRGQPHDAGWLIPLDLGMQDIAELLGATRQTISALINQWEREGLIQRFGQRRFRIPSLERLLARFPELR